MTDTLKPITADRGKYLGAVYIARRPCGKVSAMCWDDKGHEKETAKLVAGYIKRGDTVERVDRYENDPQPDWMSLGCKSCKKSGNQQGSSDDSDRH